LENGDDETSPTVAVIVRATVYKRNMTITIGLRQLLNGLVTSEAYHPGKGE
jgi:hypothetical protein